jgi:16S rRNA (cytidine1402-2'-O)-methyltransferase
MSTLFIVSTPIGNLGDITYRAVETLRAVDVIACEDTRVTKKLLDRYEISKPLISYNAHASVARHDEIVALLREGKKVALVSDAGTPTISDPGSMLVKMVRDELGDQVSIVPIPGASALLAALSASGFPSSDFLFLGFLPHKKGRETLFKEIAASERTVVFYESPHRIEKSLESLDLVLESDRKICVARELTKMFEEIQIGTATEIANYYKANQDKVRGEFVVIVSGK